MDKGWILDGVRIIKKNVFLKLGVFVYILD